MMDDNREVPDSIPVGGPPPIVGDVVFGGMDSPVAVCTLASRTLLPALAGRPEIAVAGRVYTENVGIERMVQNLAAFESVRFLIVCGRETRHKVGQTILALHRFGLDERGRVIGSEAPEPVMPGLTDAQLGAYQERIIVIDMIGEVDAEAIVDRARVLAEKPAPPRGGASAPADAVTGAPVERVVASRDPASAWTYDPVGYFLVLVDRGRGVLRLEQHSQENRLVRVVEGTGAEEICHTVVRLGAVTLLAHAAYLGRELAKAETALRLGLDYEQDRPLAGPAPGTTPTSSHAGAAAGATTAGAVTTADATTTADAVGREESSGGDDSGHLRAP